jgi:hypothetical protein
MIRTARFAGVLGAASTLAVAMGASAQPQTVVESSAETRFQLDLAVPKAARDPLLLPGFTMNVATHEREGLQSPRDLHRPAVDQRAGGIPLEKGRTGSSTWPCRCAIRAATTPSS